MVLRDLEDFEVALHAGLGVGAVLGVADGLGRHLAAERLLGEKQLDVVAELRVRVFGERADEEAVLTVGDLTGNVAESGNINHTAVGTYMRYYNVSDAAGNAATQQVRTVNVVDTTPPVIICPPDVTLECGPDVDTSPAATGEAIAHLHCALGRRMLTVEEDEQGVAWWRQA